jgi:hypothetical protein
MGPAGSKIIRAGDGVFIVSASLHVSRSPHPRDRRVAEEREAHRRVEGRAWAAEVRARRWEKREASGRRRAGWRAHVGERTSREACVHLQPTPASRSPRCRRAAKHGRSAKERRVWAVRVKRVGGKRKAQQIPLSQASRKKPCPPANAHIDKARARDPGAREAGAGPFKVASARGARRNLVGESASCTRRGSRRPIRQEEDGHRAPSQVRRGEIQARQNTAAQQRGVKNRTRADGATASVGQRVGGQRREVQEARQGRGSLIGGRRREPQAARM